MLLKHIYMIEKMKDGSADSPLTARMIVYCQLYPESEDQGMPR